MEVWWVSRQGQWPRVTTKSSNSPSASRASLAGNTASDNALDGFFLSGSDNNTLEQNRAWFNDGYGFLVDAVMANLFANNFCLLNGLGDSNQPGIC